MEWNKTFGNYATSKGLTSKPQKQLIQFNISKQHNQKWTEGLNRYFPQTDIQMAR